MTWILFSLLAAFLWSIVNIVDKYVMGKWIKNPTIPIIFTGIIGVIASFFVFLINGFQLLSLSLIILALIAGIFYILMTLFYLKAVQIEEISRIIPLFYLSPIVLAIFSRIFLREILTPVQYIGIALLIIGAILISSKKLVKITLNKAFFFMILAVLSLSIYSIILKYLLTHASFWQVFAYMQLCCFILTIPIFLFNYRDLIIAIKNHGKKIVLIMALNALIDLSGVLAITIATSIGYVSLVSSLASIQPFFVLLMASSLSIFYPKILKEETQKSTIALKFIAIALMFIGAILII
ncbi:MAG: EamA family transporter [Patescibacteria group bacterium]